MRASAKSRAHGEDPAPIQETADEFAVPRFVTASEAVSGFRSRDRAPVPHPELALGSVSDVLDGRLGLTGWGYSFRGSSWQSSTTAPREGVGSGALLP